MTMPGIDVTAPCPRVNFEIMSQYTGKRVRFVGKVEQISENTMKVRSSDDSIVEVILSGAAPDGPYVEIDGTVEGPNTIREDSSTSFGSSFGTFIYNMFNSEGNCGICVRTGVSYKFEFRKVITQNLACWNRLYANYNASLVITDMQNYNEVCKLMNGPYQRLFL